MKYWDPAKDGGVGGKEEQLAETQSTAAVQGGGGAGGGGQSQRLKPRSNLPGKQGARRLDTQQPPSLEALPRSSQPPAVRVEVTPRPKLPGQLCGRRKLLQAGGWAGSAKWPARLPWPQRQREGLRRGREQGPQEGPQPLVGPREAQAESCWTGAQRCWWTGSLSGGHAGSVLSRCWAWSMCQNPWTVQLPEPQFRLFSRWSPSTVLAPERQKRGRCNQPSGQHELT